MDTLPVTRIFTGAHTYRTPSSREAERAAIAAALAEYEGPIDELPGFTFKPRPPRMVGVLPEYKLIRRPKPAPKDLSLDDGPKKKPGRAPMKTITDRHLFVMRDYAARGLSLTDAGNALDIDPKQIGRWAKRFGIDFHLQVIRPLEELVVVVRPLLAKGATLSAMRKAAGCGRDRLMIAIRVIEGEQE